LRRNVERAMEVGTVVLLASFLFNLAQAAAQVNRGLAASSVTSAPAQPLGPSANMPADLGNDFVIGIDDVLAIVVWKEPDLSRKSQVRSDGKISLPLMGEVQAAGRTPLQLEQDIAGKLQNYLAKPKVTVMVEEVNSKKFNILGQVTRPGAYPLSLAPTVMDAIATAGGLRDFAKQKNIYVLRHNPSGGESRINFNYKEFIKGGNPAQNVKLEPHDTVVVP